MKLAEFHVRDAIEQEHLPALMELFAAEWWTASRQPAEDARALDCSNLVFALMHQPSDQLAGFARVLTDRTFLAVILDVIVGARFRRLGLGSLLMNAVLTHPDIAGVRSVELICQPELVPFYAHHGFTEQVGRSRLMRRTTDPLLTSVSKDQYTTGP